MTRPITIHDEPSRARALQHIAALSLQKPWQITVEPKKARRSLSQNALMHKWIDEVVRHVSEYTGYTHQEVHDFLKVKFLSPKRIVINGETVERYTTTDLTVQEMTNYMDQIYAWATSELGILLPLPEEMGRR